MWILLAVVLLSAALPAAASAHGELDGYPPAGTGRAEIRAIETEVLGPEHVAEHAALRNSNGEQGPIKGTGGKIALASEGAAPQAPGSPAEIGEWTQAPFALPTYAINSTVLPTGKVMFWGRPPRPVGGGTPTNVGEAALWSPWLGTGPEAFTDIEPPVIDPDGPGPQAPGPAPFFCSGLSQLPSGEVVVAGGTLVYPNTFTDDAFTRFAGLQTIYTFDPFTETWIRQPDLATGRWYPTQVLLPDGRTVVAGGLTDSAPGAQQSDSLEIFNPPPTVGGQGTVEQHPSADYNLNLYPHLFTLDSDSLLLAGPSASQVATLDTTTFTWQNGPHMLQTRLKGNAVRLPGSPEGSDTFTSIGGYSRPPDVSYYPATETTETLDLDRANPTWTPGAPLNVARANANTVQLPDDTMVTVGGGSGFQVGGEGPYDSGGYATYADGRARQVELYDPDSNSWRLGPAQQEDRTYHSTAVLLPDGRVFSAGDDKHPLEPNGENSRTDTAELYSPPYLFKGPRPVIDSAPQTVHWGDAFGIESASPDLDRAVLMAPGATTHAVDMHQREVKLEVLNRVDGEGIDVVSPPSASVAPPGYYMLFLLDQQGVPSVASWVKIDPTAPDQPTIGPEPEPPAVPDDFNGDGFADRAIGVPLEDVDGTADAGAINVFYGSPDGLAASANETWDQGELRGGPDPIESGDRFGAALASGDFDGDGFTDLAVGVPFEDSGTATDSGTVEIIHGSAAGLVADAEHWNQDSDGIIDTTETGDRLGAALAAGDLDGDGDDDLALGAPAEGVGPTPDAGAVSVIYGSPTGLEATNNQLWHQNSAGIGEAAESGDSFGAALAIGDLDGDGDGDLAVGAPAEEVGTTAGAGALNVIYGSAGGLTAANSQLWHQNSEGVDEKVEAGDAFGTALATGDLNGDGSDDLAVGVPSESAGSTQDAGSVNVLMGSGAGLTSAGDQLWSQNRPGILEVGEAGDSFGAALIAADLNGDDTDDLAIGAPSESVGAVAGGAVNVLYGSGAGLSSAGNQLWSQDSVGILDTAEPGDAFGASLGAGAFDTGADDLAVGAPAEGIDAAANAGSVSVLYGTGSGLAAADNKLWSQDSVGILDTAEPGDAFGASLGAGAR